MSIIGLKALGLAPTPADRVQSESTRHYKSESTEHYTPSFVPFWSPFEGDWERFIPIGTPKKVIEGWRRDRQDLGKWGAIMRGEAVPVSKRRRGIVMLAGGPTYTLNAYINCRLLRHMGCRLPIEWFYLGDAEISAEWKGKIQATLKDIYLVNLGGDDRNNTKKRGGWQAKIEAIIRSTCDDVLFLDADSFPHCNPKQLFDHPFFKEHDCVLWPDIRKFKRHKREWMQEKYGIDIGWQEVESGQMMFHKPKCCESLQKTREINQNHREVYKVLHGDKDTFLAGAIHANINWAIVPHKVCRDSERNLVQMSFDGENAFTHLTGKSNKWKYDSQAAIDRNIYPHWETAVNVYDELKCEGLLSPHVAVGKSHIKAPDRFCYKEAVRIIEKDMYEIRPMIGHRVPVEYIVDIGANAGGFTVAASNAFPHAKILAVEADPELEQGFRSNTADCKAEIHYVKKACVGKTPPSRIEFLRATHFRAASFVGGRAGRNANEHTEEIRVPAVTLPNLLKEHGFPRIDILKIDAEGVEGEIFSSLREAGVMPRVHWIRGEWHGQDDRPIIEAALRDTHDLRLCSGTTHGKLIAHNKIDADDVEMKWDAIPNNQVIGNRVFFVVGPESSGTRLLTEILVKSGCWGDYTHEQRYDSEVPPANCDWVVRRSVPHGPKVLAGTDQIDTCRWNVFRPTLNQAEQYGRAIKDVFFLVAARDWIAISKSQVKHGHVDSIEESLENIDKAYTMIFRQVAKPPFGNFRLVNYEWLVTTPEAIPLLQKSLGLPQTEIQLKLRNENTKHYQ